ncbi:trypsin-like peptidase domain-containing protein [Streptococcus cuniculi]|nr:trypsin-like peptidase domain-containing protein [Streptococcus cuniculi]MBF0778027.1 trypsin-like peptidase domain-containing protein [Streptococcus cuniculi]
MKLKKLVSTLLVSTVMLGSLTPSLVSATDTDTSTTATTVASTSSDAVVSSDTSSSSSVEPSIIEPSSSSTDVTVDSSSSTVPDISSSIVPSTNTTSDATVASSSSDSTTPNSSETTPSVTADETAMILERAGVLESIIGADNRYQVKNIKTDPYRKIVYLESVFPDGLRQGTGIMIGTDTILTAAHNLYDEETGNWASSVLASPGHNGSTAPYGVYSSKKFYVLRNYRLKAGDSNYDMGVIKLDRKVNAAVKSVGVSKSVSKNQRVQVAGYPGGSGGRMYTMFGTVDDIADNLMSYTIDTEPGQSGAPVLNSKNQVVGIHIVGVGEYGFNVARRVKDDSLRMITLAQKGKDANREVSTNFERKTGNTYRLYHSGIKRHLYTQDLDEATILSTQMGWNFEDVKFVTATTGKPVYRLYHSGTREHIYTTDANEKNVLSKRGWRYEGIAWYSSGSRPVYRLYHSGLKVHLYTVDANEKNVLSKRGWRYEGVSFYTK